MDDDHDLDDFSNITRLFPLPGVVMFPHSILPLHIFEPRYRQMTEDALGSDQLITIVQIRPPGEWESPALPSLERFGCIGRIFKHDRLPDGRFNFLLLGRKRVELTREIPSGKLYRMSEVRVIEDIPPDEPDESSRDELITAFRGLHKGGLDPDLDSLFDSELPLGVLTDIMAADAGASFDGQTKPPVRTSRAASGRPAPRPAPGDEGAPSPVRRRADGLPAPFQRQLNLSRPG